MVGPYRPSEISYMLIIEWRHVTWASHSPLYFSFPLNYNGTHIKQLYTLEEIMRARRILILIHLFFLFLLYTINVCST